MTLVVAPAGFGKSVAIRHFLEAGGGAVLRYDVRESHTSLNRFVRGLAGALEPSLPKVPQSLAIAHERAMQSPNAPDVLSAWVAEHLAGESRTIVIDDYHHCEGDATIAAFLSRAIERTRANVRWIVASRTIAELPLATWLARGDAELPIDEGVLRFSHSDAQQLAQQIAPSVDASLVKRILEATSGSPGKIVFALHSAEREPSIVKRLLDAGGDLYRRLSDEIFQSLSPAEVRLLVESTFFPDLSEELFVAAGYDGAGRLLDGLRAKIPEAFRTAGDRLRYCTLFRNELAARLAAQGAEACQAANVRTANALELTGRTAEALAYYVRGREFGALAQLIEKRGLAFVEAGYGDTILEAIDALDPIAQTNSPVVLAIKAMFESRIGRFDTAESWFQLAIERAADGAVRNQITYQYGTHLLRFFRPEAIGLLEGLAADPAADEDLRAYALAALGPAYVFERRLDDASRTAERALHLADGSQNPHLRARAHHQAAYVALYGSKGERSKELAATSLATAREHGYFDVAAGALTVLYSVASDLQDDPAESLRLLEEVADCAAKSGSLTNHLLALIAKLEIEVERGDEDAIAELDEKLRTLDVTCCSRPSYEALLPSQALRASWSGDYAGAYRLLASSVWQQWSTDRKALRWAEIAVYAAAASLHVEATAAIRCALELLEELEPLDVRVARARLLVALATIILGRPDEARELFDSIDAHPQALSPRLRALRRALGALRDRYRGVRNQDAILSYFQELERQHFGGLARMIMTLPLADNASLRLRELSMDERRILAQLALDRALTSDTRVESIVAKLGCADRQAALRAVIRHPLIIHLPTNGTLTSREKVALR